MVDACADCGREFDTLGRHLCQTECSYPVVSEHKLEVLSGMLMGDASLYRQANLPYFQVRMINEEFLEHLDERFETLGRGVSLDRTAKETAKRNRETGFSPNAKAENCSDLYLWRTMAHPKFREFEHWYKEEGKRFPDDLELTPTILKYWYISDGYVDSDYRNGITLSAWNERDRPTYIHSLFNTTPISVQRFDDEGGIHFSVEDSKELLDWIGKPLPGFEYKWKL